MNVPAFQRATRSAILLAALGAGVGALLSACMTDSKGSGSGSSAGSLKITEIHYNPASQDTVSGDDYEFIELKNTSSSSIAIGGYAFTDGIQYTFAAGTAVPAGGFVVLASNAARFQERYGFAPSGVYEGHLSNSGETVVLAKSASGAVVASVSYGGGAWPSGADGGGYSLVLKKSASDYSATSWRASYRLHGTPGKDDGGVVLVNEVLTHTDLPKVDAVELFNYGEDTAHIGGWFLSDDKTYPKKYRIPAGTTIPPMGYVVFDETNFNAHPGTLGNFRLSAHGDDVWLFQDSTGCSGGYCHGAVTTEIENGVTFGRVVTSDGRELFLAQKAPTLGAANVGPRVGSVVITEIMYHPANDTDEYVEITNVGAQPVALYDTLRLLNTWKLKGLSFNFPAGITLAAGERVLVVPASATKARVRSAYGIDTSVRIFEAAGKLSNSSETVSLERPFDPFIDPGSGTSDSTLPYILMDRVSYRDSDAWPKSADGEGYSLERKKNDEQGDDPANWKAVLPSPGH
ncbi:MAG TPA: lamin tail domain-containing protein [Fibrobacteria bacterium]|jgi:hypothetical protein|nr:lamin tail domain-containing protein [Fibrobacteria bacterium]